MTRKSSISGDNPEAEQLALEERRAEVDTKKARAESAKADAHKKKKDAGLGEDDLQLDEKLAGGVVREHFATIMRKMPGESRWPFWRRSVPLDEIDSLEDYIRAESDLRFEHKVIVHNGNQKPLKKPIFFPAEESDPGATSLSAIQRELKETERQIKERRELKRLEARRRQLEEEDDGGGGEDGPDNFVFVPHMGGYFPPNHPAVMGMYTGGGFGQQKEDSGMGMLKTLVPVLVAWITKTPDKSPLEAMIPFLLKGTHDGQLAPKDMIGMFSPFVMEMSKMNAESSRMMMEGMSKMDDTFRKKVLDLLMSDPSRSPDEIEKWQRWMNFGESALRKAAGVVRDSLKDTGAPKKDLKKVETKKAPTAGNLTGPKKEGEAQGGGGTAAGGNPITAAAANDPKENAAKVRKERLDIFLLAMEEEMLVESDPVLMAGKCQEIYLTLPASLRKKVEEATDDDPPSDEKMLELFAKLKEISPEMVDRIGLTIMEYEDNQEWLKAFLFACSHEDEDDDEGEEEGEEETAPAPAGGTELPEGAEGA